MPQYRTILKRARKANITGPALVGAIGEGLKGLASGLNAKHQRNMDVQQAELATKRQEEDAAYKQKQQEQWEIENRRAERKLEEELGKSGVERSRIRNAHLELSTLLTNNPNGLTPKQIKEGRNLLDAYGTSVDAATLRKDFAKTISEAGKPESGAGGMSESESRMQRNDIISLERENIENKVKPLESRMKAEIKRVEDDKKRTLSDPKNFFVPDADDEKDIEATEAKRQALEDMYDQRILDIQVRYDDKINSLWQGFEQRSAPGGPEALQDTVKNNIPRQSTGIPRLDEARGILDQPLEPTKPALGVDVNLLESIYSGDKPNAAMTSVATSAPNSKPVTDMPQAGELTDEQLLATQKQSEVPDKDLERWIDLHTKPKEVEWKDEDLLKLSAEEAADLPDAEFNRWKTLKRR